MKFLPTMTQEEFRRQLPFIPDSGLLKLLEGVYEYCQSSDPKITMDMKMDMERKQTKIWFELQRRGVLNTDTNQEFQAWLYAHRPPKRFY